MCIVYILQSIENPSRYYVGLTDDSIRRLEEHNQGKCPHTSKFKPWKTILSIQFSNLEKARSFERYLKSGSGRAFSKRHF